MKKLILFIGAFMLNPTLSSANDINNEFNKLEDTVQDMEGNTYRTVKIGEQVWLAENLRSTKFQDGSAIKTGFIPKDDPKNLLKYGRLYDWHDVTDQRSICPIGWRVASDDDWKELEKTIGMSEIDLDKKGWRGEGEIANTLKETQPNSAFKKFNQSEVNKHKFFARPAGVKMNRWYITQGIYSEFWTSSDASTKAAYNRTFAYSWWNFHKGEIYRAALSKNYMFSVRCIKK